MQKAYRKRLHPAEWFIPLSLIPQEFPTTILVFGVVANFAWLAVVFWFLSYWIVWH